MLKRWITGILSAVLAACGSPSESTPHPLGHASAPQHLQKCDYDAPTLDPSSMHFDSAHSKAQPLFVKCGNAISYQPTNCEDTGVADIEGGFQRTPRGYRYTVTPKAKGRCHQTFFSVNGSWRVFHVTVVVKPRR